MIRCTFRIVDTHCGRVNTPHLRSMSASQRLGVESTIKMVARLQCRMKGLAAAKLRFFLLVVVFSERRSAPLHRLGLDRLLFVSCFEGSCHVLRVALHYVSGAFSPLRVMRVTGFSWHLDPSACSHTFVHQLVSLRLHLPASIGGHHHSDLRGVFNARLKLDYSALDVSSHALNLCSRGCQLLQRPAPRSELMLKPRAASNQRSSEVADNTWRCILWHSRFPQQTC